MHVTHDSASVGTAGISNICLALLRSAAASSQINELHVLLSEMQECHLPVGLRASHNQMKTSQNRVRLGRLDQFATNYYNSCGHHAHLQESQKPAWDITDHRTL